MIRLQLSTALIFSVCQIAGALYAVASPETASRVARLDRAFRGTSATRFEPIPFTKDMWNKLLIRGQSIELSNDGKLHVKYEQCLNGTVIGLARPGKEPLVTGMPCDGGREWENSEQSYSIGGVDIATIAVRPSDAPFGPKGGLEVQFRLQNTNTLDKFRSIPCKGRESCQKIADDVRGLAVAMRSMFESSTRIDNGVRGLLFRKEIGPPSDRRVLVIRPLEFWSNLRQPVLKQKVCMRKADQDCDRDKLWRETALTAAFAELNPTVEINEAQLVSDDKKIGVAIVRCHEGKCWGNGSEGRIVCRAGDGCQEMKRDLEELISLANAPDGARQDGGAAPTAKQLPRNVGKVSPECANASSNRPFWCN